MSGLYCYVQNNQVVEGPRTLPKDWGGYTNFYLLDDPTRLSLGWYPYVLEDLGAPSPYYTRTLSPYDIQATQVVQEAIYTPWDLETLRNVKNQELEANITIRNPNEVALNPKVSDYTRFEYEWLAGQQAALLQITDWQEMADFDTTMPDPLVLPNNRVADSYVDQGLALTAQNSAATESGIAQKWSQPDVSAFVSANKIAADDVSGAQPPTQPNYKIRQGIAKPSEAAGRTLFHRFSVPVGAKSAISYGVRIYGRNDTRQLYSHVYSNGTFVETQPVVLISGNVWGFTASEGARSYASGDLSFTFAYNNNKSDESAFFTEAYQFPAGVAEKQVILTWDPE